MIQLQLPNNNPLEYQHQHPPRNYQPTKNCEPKKNCKNLDGNRMKPTNDFCHCSNRVAGKRHSTINNNNNNKNRQYHSLNEIRKR